MLLLTGSRSSEQVVEEVTSVFPKVAENLCKKPIQKTYQGVGNSGLSRLTIGTRFTDDSRSPGPSARRDNYHHE